MEIRRLNYDDVKQYKKDIIVYLEDTLKENEIEYEGNYIITLYSNMCEFCKDGSAIIYGAIEDDKLCGFIWGYLIKESRIHINFFIVNKKMRSKGIGQKLINEIYNYSIINKIEFVELMASIANENTIKFYKKQGFEVERVKMEKKIFTNGEK